jgi:hypothetical protein
MAPLADLRDAIEHLATIERSSCSPGEHEAARFIAGKLSSHGADARVELERVHGTYWWPLGITSAAGLLAGLLGLRGRRLTAAALGCAASALVVDDLGAGRRWLRRILPKQATANVVAVAGDLEATNTLLVAAHHDAAHTGLFFDPRLTELLGKRLGAGEGKPVRQPPLMAPFWAGPAAAGLAASLGARRIAALAIAVCGGIIACLTEMSFRRTVPGANDNLTGVATLIGLAASLEELPVSGLRVLLVSTGAEESLMEGMRAFAARHPEELSPHRTRMLCVDTVGSPQLVLAESEGMARTRDYDRALKDLIADCAEQEGIELRRGFRMRLGTDGYLALRRGVPAAMLMSVDRYGVSSNYHWPTDTAERVDYATLADAVRLSDAVMRRLAHESAS